jgi:hypothetical protein
MDQNKSSKVVVYGGSAVGVTTAMVVIKVIGIVIHKAVTALIGVN